MEKMLKRSFRYCIDLPQPKEKIVTPFVTVKGWIYADKDKTLTEPILYNWKSKEVHPLTVVRRPDVEAAFPDRTILAFQACLSVSELKAGHAWQVRFLLDGKPSGFRLKFSLEPEIAHQFEKQKWHKLQKIASILRCPICYSDRLEISTALLHCQHCHAQFYRNSNRYNFLNTQFAEYGNIKPTAEISANEYDPIARKLIQQFTDGLILDNGCGLRHFYYDNIVNLDVVDYPTTDVLAIGEKLPFKSNVFDAIFSLVVLEHVKNPFECAKEIRRVLKPGGTLYAVVPFLQPFHGYPDHYYNMTSSGLKNLFSDLEIVECNVPLSGLPIASLSWFLNSYLRGLPAPVAEQFKNMKIADLLGHPESYIERDFVQNLPPEVNEELASCNYIIAQKNLTNGQN